MKKIIKTINASPHLIDGLKILRPSSKALRKTYQIHQTFNKLARDLNSRKNNS